MRLRAAALLLVLVGAGCASERNDLAWQNSTIDALLDGNFDGETTFAEVRKHGDFGLGTFDAVDGEMLALEGRFYQVRSDGHVYAVPPNSHTPFSIVTFFIGSGEFYRSLPAPLDYA